MNEGSYISGGGHVALIAGLLLGGWLGTDPPPPPQVTDVSVITEQEYAALALPDAQPDTQFDVPTPAAPEVSDAPAPVPRPEIAPVPAETPEPELPENPDTPPVVPDRPEPPTPELADDLPGLITPDTPLPELPLVAAPAEDTTPRDAPRVAPVPVPEAPVSPRIADTPTPPVSPEADTPLVAEEQPEAAPEEATTEIVTEAETPADTAPTGSHRPVARPSRPAAAEAEPAPAPENPAADAIAEAVASAVAEEPDPEADPEPVRPAAPTGPPLTRSDKEGLRVAVQRCWNVGSLSSEALSVTVVVTVSMQRDGKPADGSIRMLSSSGGGDASARQAFEAARRAIIRCGLSGYDLPVEKYEQWREIEMTFNPDSMRVK